MSRNPQSLGSLANAHTAADLHVRPNSQFALDLRTMGAANGLSDSTPYFACNGCAGELYANGISFASAKLRQRLSRYEDKGLNLRDESKRRNGGHKPHACAKKIFIKSLRLSGADGFFQVLVGALLISDYARARFFVQRNRVTFSNVDCDSRRMHALDSRSGLAA